jgi:hypothetical protein
MILNMNTIIRFLFVHLLFHDRVSLKSVRDLLYFEARYSKTTKFNQELASKCEGVTFLAVRRSSRGIFHVRREIVEQDKQFQAA